METVDWTRLPDDIGIQIFLLLNVRDRGSFSSTCRSLRKLRSSQFLWQSLDLRFHEFGDKTACALYCHRENLQKLCSNGGKCTYEVIKDLEAVNLREIKDYECKDVNTALDAIAGGHPALEILELYNFGYQEITSDRIQMIYVCCRQLKKLKFSYVKKINNGGLDALHNFCHNLTEISFTDCKSIEEVALGKVCSLRFLSVAGTSSINWELVCDKWPKLPNLIGLDLSRTDVKTEVVSKLLLNLSGLKTLCCLDTTDRHINANGGGDIRLILDYDDMCHWLRVPITHGKERHKLIDFHLGKDEKERDEITTWLESIFSCYLVEKFRGTSRSIWICNAAGALVLRLLTSSQEDVQEMVVKVLANASMGRVGYKKSQHQDKVISRLLELANSQQEVLQSEATKAIIHLSNDRSLLRSIVDQRGISTLINLTKSNLKSVAEVSARRLCDLALEEEYKNLTMEAGGVRALLDSMSNLSKSKGDVSQLQEYVARTLANLATDVKCAMEIASIRSPRGLLELAHSCNNQKVLEQIVRTIVYLLPPSIGNVEVDRVPELLVDLIRSPRECICQAALGAISDLCQNDGCPEAFESVGVIKSLVSPIRSYFSSKRLEPCVTNALWGLSLSKANSIAIERESGVRLMAEFVSYSRYPLVQRNAAGILGNLLHHSCVDIHRVEREVVPSLVHLCATSPSEVSRFVAALALALMLGGRRDVPKRNTSSQGARKMALSQIKAFTLSICDRSNFKAAARSMDIQALDRIANAVSIPGASSSFCSKSEMETLVHMLRSSSFPFVLFAAFAIFQLTCKKCTGQSYKKRLLQKAGGVEIVRDLTLSKADYANDVVIVLSTLILQNIS